MPKAVFFETECTYALLRSPRKLTLAQISSLFFYIDRFDIRHDNEEELREGRNSKIVELKGAASEATSI